MEIGGFANRMLHVDMSAGSTEVKEIPEEWARLYIGARGLGVRYVFENGPEVDPLSPENILCFMNGPLTGTAANMSGRMAVVTKSPLTNTVCDSHQGGWSAARLRWAGYDGIIFKGKADKPTYLFIDNDGVELRDASEVWGKNVHETVDHFKELYGEKDLTVIAIGQAGENLSRFACWLNEDDRASGRGGTGAVGGSKNLKAIVIKAKKAMPKPADKDSWKKAHSRALAVIMDEANITSPNKGGLSLYGTNVLMNITNTIGALPAYNGKVTSYGDECENLSGEHVYDTILVAHPTCHACPVACKKEVELPEDPYKGLRMESIEYESAWALGANSGHHNINAVAKLIDECNEYGLDTIELGNLYSTYMEMSEKGVMNGDPVLAWGDWERMVELVPLIALREGIGDALAEGPARFSDQYGVPELSNNCKGMSIPAYDPRGLKGMGLGYATSNRGACHLRAYTPAAELNVMPFGSLSVDPLHWEGKGELVKAFQDIHAFSDSLDLCKFSAFAQGMAEYVEQYSTFCGIEFTIDEGLQAGERIYNLERYYNNLAGYGEGSDTLPRRFTEEASDMPGSMGHVCELDLMLNDYYSARGWHDGVAPIEKLRELGVDEAIL
ncbi:MAG: aldehyde ferredoxin oxidoreductase family protein [Candidatus Promineifilaceae bacterium]|jgi:aldehyde:ferredoxin oxidoreductase